VPYRVTTLDELLRTFSDAPSDAFALPNRDGVDVVTSDVSTCAIWCVAEQLCRNHCSRSRQRSLAAVMPIAWRLHQILTPFCI